MLCHQRAPPLLYLLMQVAARRLDTTHSATRKAMLKRPVTMTIAAG